MKKALLFAIIPVGIMLVYFLFQPIFDHNIGWKDIPVKTFSEHNKKMVSENSFSPVISQSEEILQEAQKALSAPAISVAVGLNGNLIWANAQGYEDIDQQKKADVTTSFRIGSTSKAITSVALGKLLQTQKLHLDTPVQQYVPYLTIQEPVSIRQLASHTSGIRNYSTCFCLPVWEYYNNDQYDNLEESIAVFQNDQLLFEPGSQYSYSSYNFTLLSAAIEEAAGVTFLDYVENAIFSPLEMNKTSADYDDKDIEGRAAFYEIRDGQYKETFEVDNSNKWAGGGFISTPSDLVKLGNALLNNRILKTETVDTLFTPQKLNNGNINKEGYALGWRSSREQPLFNGEKLTYVVHHGGVAMGSTSFFILFPDYNLVVSLLMNRSAPSEFREFSKYAFLIAEEFIKQIEEDTPKSIP